MGSLLGTPSISGRGNLDFRNRDVISSSWQRVVTMGKAFGTR